MNGFDNWIAWLYGEGDILMVACRLVVFIFVLEAGAYFVSLLSAITRGCR